VEVELTPELLGQIVPMQQAAVRFVQMERERHTNAETTADDLGFFHFKRNRNA
jgi:hypothetical protein